MDWIMISNNNFTIPRYSTLFDVNGGWTYNLKNNRINFVKGDTATSETTVLLSCNNTIAKTNNNHCPGITDIQNNQFVNTANGALTGVIDTTGAPGSISGDKMILKCNDLIDNVGTVVEYQPDGSSWQLPLEWTICVPTTTATNASANTTTQAANATTNTSTTTTTTTTLLSNSSTNSTTLSSTTTSSSTTTTVSNMSPTTSSTTSTTPTTTTAQQQQPSSSNTTLAPLTIPPMFTTEKPIPAAVQDARNVEQDAEVTATSTTAAAAAFSMPAPSLVTLASRAGIVTRLVSCESSLDEPLPFYINPTGMELDVGSYKARFHVGAIVANMAILIGFGLLSLLIAFIHGMIAGQVDERSILGVRYRSLGAGRFPGALVFPLLFFMQPFIGSSLTVLVYGNINGAVIAVVVLLLTILISVALGRMLLDKQGFLATYRTRDQITFDKMMTDKENAEKGIFLKAEEQSCLDKFGAFYEEEVEGVWGWWYDVPRDLEDLDYDQREKIDLKRLKNCPPGHKSFLKRNGAAFDYYNTEYRWFLICEILASLCLGIGDGLVEVIGCSNVAILCCVVFALYVIAVFAIRPFATRKDFVFGALITLFNFAGAVLTALPEGTMDEEARERDIIFVSSAALFVGTVAAVEGIVANGTRFLVEKCGSDDEEQHQQQQNGDNSREKEVPLVEIPNRNAAGTISDVNHNNNNNTSTLEGSHRYQQQPSQPLTAAPQVISASPSSAAKYNVDDLDDL